MYTNHKQAREALEKITQSVEEFQGGTREEYLAWVQNWKLAYRGLSRTIRELKAARKEFRYEYSNVRGQKKRRKVGENSHYDSKACWYVLMFSDAATDMLDLRSEAKKVAAAEREKRLAEERAAA